MARQPPVRFDTDVQVYAAVGEFFHYWLYLESAVDRLITRMIRAPDLHAGILGPNIAFRRKLNILRVGARVSPHLRVLGKRDEVASLITSAASLYADRNNLAHYPWGREGGKLVIHRTQAVETLVGQPITWTKKQMRWKITECARVFGAFFDIAKAIKPIEVDSRAVLKILSELENESIETEFQQET